MDKKTTPTTKTFEEAIREACIKQPISNGIHVFCDPQKRAALIKNYSLTAVHAQNVIEKVQKEADAEYKKSIAK